jgi:hypothetical protein
VEDLELAVTSQDEQELWQLADSSRPLLLSLIANNPRAGADALDRVAARATSATTLTEVASHPNAGWYTLDLVLKRLDQLIDWKRVTHDGKQAEQVYAAVGSHRHATALVLENIVDTRTAAGTAAVARNSRTPASLLERLSERPTNQLDVACNRACPTHVLRRLAPSPDGQVRAAVMRHPRCSDKLVLAVYQNRGHAGSDALGDIRAELANRLAEVGLDDNAIEVAVGLADDWDGTFDELAGAALGVNALSS